MEIPAYSLTEQEEELIARKLEQLHHERQEMLSVVHIPENNIPPLRPPYPYTNKPVGISTDKDPQNWTSLTLNAYQEVLKESQPETKTNTKTEFVTPQKRVIRISNTKWDSITINIIRPNFQMPERLHPHQRGFTIKIPFPSSDYDEEQYYTIAPYSRKTISLGYFIDFPAGFHGIMQPCFMYNEPILVFTEAVEDIELCLHFYNHSNKPHLLSSSNRYANLYIFRSS
jgi:hypothetical protein